jgi:hypothetical protein
VGFWKKDISAISQPDSGDISVNVFYLKPMIGNYELEKFEYDVEVVKWIDGSTESNIDKMILRPIEAGNMVELCSGKEVLLRINSGTLQSVQVLKKSKESFMQKKEDLLLEMSFYIDEQQKQQKNQSSILLNVEDKKVPEIVQYVKEIMGIEETNYWSNVYDLPFFLEGESFICWPSFTLETKPGFPTEGMINKRLTWLDVVTNYRVFQYSMKKHDANYIALGALEDVVVMNQKRISQSSGYALYHHSKFHIPGIGESRFTVGDVVFVSQGRPFITFHQVQDPDGYAKQIKSFRR